MVTFWVRLWMTPNLAARFISSNAGCSLQRCFPVKP